MTTAITHARTVRVISWLAITLAFAALLVFLVDLRRGEPVSPASWLLSCAIIIGTLPATRARITRRASLLTTLISFVLTALVIALLFTR